MSFGTLRIFMGPVIILRSAYIFTYLRSGARAFVPFVFILEIRDIFSRTNNTKKKNVKKIYPAGSVHHLCVVTAFINFPFVRHNRPFSFEPTIKTDCIIFEIFSIN